MGTSCCAYGCTNRHAKGCKVSFFRIPKSEHLRKLWMLAIKRVHWTPTAGSRICGNHFQTGAPSKDPAHPDYVPNVFSFTRRKNTAVLHEKRRKTIVKRLAADEDRKMEEMEAKAAEALILLSEVPDPVAGTNNADVATTEDDKDRLISQLTMEINSLRLEKWELQRRIQLLEPTEKILSDSKKLLFNTGIRSLDTFKWIVDLIRDDVSSDFQSVETQLLIVLMKCRLNLLSTFLAGQFLISLNSVTRIFDKLIPLLAAKLEPLIKWPSKKALKRSCPQCFKNSEFENTACIIDCTEVPIERAGNQLARSQTWSSYKNAHTIKFLVAITPSGCICFISESWTGKGTDKQIAIEAGFMEKIQKGDIVLADRGFILSDYFTEKGAKLIVPPFVKNKKQLSKDEVFYGKKISNVRIHVERVIKQIKNYKILQQRVPITFLPYMDCVIRICAALANLSPPIIK